MKIKYEAPKGRRLKKQFVCLEPDEDNRFVLWYYLDFNQWSEYNGELSGDSQSWCDCRSLKAAIRKIKNWNIPKGTKFRLCSRWVGYDIYITK